VDDKSKSNPFVNEFRIINPNSKWPIENSSIDLAFCDFILEHIEYPKFFFSEVARVLKEDGYFCFRTINKYGYISILSKIFPENLHSKILQKVQPSRKEKDVFKAYYRCNSVFALKKLLEENNLDGIISTFEAEPSYHNINKFVYLIGVVYQKFVPSLFKSIIFGFTKKY